MTGNFLNLVKERGIEVQEAHGISNVVNPKRPTIRHIMIKIHKFKDKNRIIKAARVKKLVTYKGAPVRLSSDFSTETLQARRDW